MSKNAELLHTIGRTDQFPNDKFKHIVMSGRSNVGKSSLINKLLCRNKLARVSSVPGKTITINMYLVEKSFYFTDLPGYGFAKRPKNEKAVWSTLVEGFFSQYVRAENSTVAAVIQLVDMKIGPTADDIQMLEYMNYYHIPYFVVATKSDKLNVSEKKQAMERLYSCDSIAENTPIIPFSALTGDGINDIWNTIYSYLEVL